MDTHKFMLKHSQKTKKKYRVSIKSLILITALASIFLSLTAITVSAIVYDPWTRVAVDTTTSGDKQCAKIGDADNDGLVEIVIGVDGTGDDTYMYESPSPDSTLRFINPTPANSTHRIAMNLNNDSAVGENSIYAKDDVTNTQEQDFTLGVLAINTHKSIYSPDETAFIGIAVLDNEGHMICDADVTLTITAPDGKQTVLSTNNGLIKVSPECSVYGVTNLPDYYTNYTVNGVGTYVMNLTAVTTDGVNSITDEFTVQSSVDFDVARDGPTRIYPPVPYVMNFTIKANKNYTGLIKEYVPASFEIAPQEGLTVTTVGNTKTLAWNKNLVEGETYNIAYEFDAPDISPYLFVLGELEVGSWREARQWQIASDSPGEIGHGSKYVSATKTVTSSSWTVISDYTISSTNFETGKKYLVIAKTSLNNANTNRLVGFIATHGTTPGSATAFSDSEFYGEAREHSSSFVGHGYHWFTVWEAVNGENLYFAMKRSGNTGTGRSREFSAIWIKLSDDLTENTDWRYATQTHSGDASTSWETDGASLTFDGSGDDWLILAHTHWLVDSTTNDHWMRINFDGTGYSTTRYEEEDVDEKDSKMGMYIANAWSGSKTVRTEYKVDSSSSAADCTGTKIFVLRLGAFKDHWGDYSTSAVGLSSIDTWTETYGKPDYSASQTGNVTILSFEVVDVWESAKVVRHRIQVDGTTVPTNFHTANDMLPNGAADEDGLFQPYIGSASAGSRDIDIDCYEDVEVNPNPSVDIHCLCIFSMELAAEVTKPVPSNIGAN